MIPSVIDTVVFVKDGGIAKVYDLELKVKVPSGMVEQDLARPVIEIADFETGTLEYEIYTFGEENVIVPVTEGAETKSGVYKLAAEKIKETIRRFDPNPQIEVLSENNVRIKIKKDAIPSLIGKGGTTINEMEKILHVHIDVQEKDSQEPFSESSGHGVSFDFSESKNTLLFEVNKRFSGQLAELYIKDQYVATARVARHGKIKMSKRSDAGKILSRSAFSKNDIDIMIKDS